MDLVKQQNRFFFIISDSLTPSGANLTIFVEPNINPSDFIEMNIHSQFFIHFTKTSMFFVSMQNSYASLVAIASKLPESAMLQDCNAVHATGSRLPVQAYSLRNAVIFLTVLHCFANAESITHSTVAVMGH